MWPHLGDGLGQLGDGRRIQHRDAGARHIADEVVRHQFTLPLEAAQRAGLARRAFDVEHAQPGARGWPGHRARGPRPGTVDLHRADDGDRVAVPVRAGGGRNQVFPRQHAKRPPAVVAVAGSHRHFHQVGARQTLHVARLHAPTRQQRGGARIVFVLPLARGQPAPPAAGDVHPLHRRLFDAVPSAVGERQRQLLHDGLDATPGVGDEPQGGEIKVWRGVG